MIRNQAVHAIRIGTDGKNDIVLTDPTASRFHAVINRTEEGVVLRDLESKNGTWNQGVRIRECFLQPVDEIRVGATALRVESRLQECFAVPGEEESLGPLIGKSEGIRQVYAMIQAVAKTPATVLVEGESGTGKELVAQVIHELSGRSGPLVTFDAAATSPELVRAELFGHARGAFTGASEARRGSFREADGGTLFLDEIASLSPEIQPTLLRVLETREVKPLGIDRPEPIDVRLVVASNRPLKEMVREGTFRLDLYHRIGVITIKIPPLRERIEDIMTLIDHFSKAAATPCRFSSEALEALQRHPWPGNVRELRNLVERLEILHAGRVVEPPDLELEKEDAALIPAASTLEEMERRMIFQTLEKFGGHQGRTAESLGISLATLKRRLKDYGASGS